MDEPEQFAMADLDRLLERRQVVQGTLMRSTIHVVSRRDYWPFAEGIGPSRQQWWQQTWGGDEARGVDLDEVSAQLERELAVRVWPRRDLDAHLKAHGGSVWGGRGCRSSVCRPREPGPTDGQTSSSSARTGWAHHRR